jgi:hypothetical protein
VQRKIKGNLESGPGCRLRPNIPNIKTNVGGTKMYRGKSRKWLLTPILATVALSLGLGVYGVQVLRGDAEVEGASGEHDADAPQVLQCYNLEEGDLQSERALLTTDNFGRDVVGITQATMMCEQARKFHPSASGGTTTGTLGDHVFECYRLVAGADPNDQVRLTTRNFGDDRVVVRKAVMMCEGARKEHAVEPGQEPNSFGTPGEHVLACYRIQGGDNPQAKVELANRNFGKDRVIVGPAIIMCEEANKRTHNNGEGVGQPNGFVWECYALNHGDDPNATVVLETKNFGKDKVIVRHARMMCERARKDHSASLGDADVLTD